MVVWNDENISKEAGKKARNLSQIELLPVPRFFVVTPRKVQRLFGGGDPASAELDQSVKEEVEEAYSNVDVSSGIREAPEKAKSLVGGQRSTQRVSIRVSSNSASCEHRLNVGPSDFFRSIREVASSYTDTQKEYPALIVQKMVSPEFTGAVVNEYSQGGTLVEVVKGLGSTLERGTAKPHVYLVSDDASLKSDVAEKQTYEVRNPSTGKRQSRTESFENPPIDASEVKRLAGKSSSIGLSLKFVYARNTFHIVDAWGESPQLDIDANRPLEYLRATEQEPSGIAGSDFAYSKQTVEPQEPFVARHGGWTSTHSQQARSRGVAAIVRYQGDIQVGDALNSDKNRTGRKGETTATRVSTLESYQSKEHGSGSRGYQSGSGHRRSSHIEEFGDFFRFDGSEAFVDARELDSNGIRPALDYIDADYKTLVLPPDFETATVEAAVRAGFDRVLVDKSAVDRLRREVEREERRFILERIRELD
jgi:Pyruvate phosphate dikinase, PEP/pyruvate binding domain.